MFVIKFRDEELREEKMKSVINSTILNRKVHDII
jgi:hypothetical protein